MKGSKNSKQNKTKKIIYSFFFVVVVLVAVLVVVMRLNRTNDNNKSVVTERRREREGVREGHSTLVSVVRAFGFVLRGSGGGGCRGRQL